MAQRFTKPLIIYRNNGALPLDRAVSKPFTKGVCNTSHRMERMNLLKLSMALGNRFPITRIKSKLRCNKCSSGDCEIRIVWAGNGSQLLAAVR